MLWYVRPMNWTMLVTSNSFRQCDNSTFPSFGGTMSNVDAPQRWPLATLGSSRLLRLDGRNTVTDPSKRWSKSPRGSPPLTHSTAGYESSSTVGYMPVYGLSLPPDPGWFKFMGSNELGCASMQPHVGGACKMPTYSSHWVLLANDLRVRHRYSYPANSYRRREQTTLDTCP